MRVVKRNRNEVGVRTGGADIVSLIMFPWRMETRLRGEDPSGGKAPVGVFGR